MKFKLNLIQASLIAAMTVASAGASAAVFNDFDVTEGSVPGAIDRTFTADKITGNYVEVVSFNLDGTFDASIKWNAGQFVADDGVNPVASQLGATGAVFPQQYGLYGLFQASGTFATVAGVTTFNFAPGGSLGVWIDPDTNTTFVEPATGDLAWGTVNDGDDYLIATGSVLGGEGTLDTTLSTCGEIGETGPGINCGSFGTTTSFLLTAAGSNYFTAPIPFYNVAFESGQLNNFEVAGRQEINGSLDVVFANVIPEPSSIALMGLGLVGLGLGLRRRKQA